MARSNSHNSILCRQLIKVYGQGETQVKALRGADVEVRYGELFMLVGPSGCGKTTLISIVTTLMEWNEGTCEVLGQDIAAMSLSERIAFRCTSVGFVFQGFNLLPALTALENVSVPLLLNGLPRPEAEERAKETLNKVGLSERTEALPRQLSGGQQQRVAIARALIHNPKLIVCDEPTSNLDHKTGAAMMKLLRDRAKKPERSVLVVTHDPRIYGFADRIARMDDGKIIDVLEGKERKKLL